jgi:putative transposase
MPKRRRRSFTPQFKAQVVLEVLAGLRSQAEVARQHKLKPELVARWKETALDGLETLFQAGADGIRSRAGSPSWSGWSGGSPWSLKPQKKPRPCSPRP